MHFLTRVRFVAHRISQSTYRKQPRSRRPPVLRCLLPRRQDAILKEVTGVNLFQSDCCHAHYAM
jgi:hypothetical protein